MKAIHAVTAAVLMRGKATAKDIAPDFPHLTDEQVRIALRNATFRKYLQRANNRQGGPKRYEAEYCAPGCAPKPEPEQPRARPAVSVWDYAQRAA